MGAKSHEYVCGFVLDSDGFLTAQGEAKKKQRARMLPHAPSQSSGDCRDTQSCLSRGIATAPTWPGWPTATSCSSLLYVSPRAGQTLSDPSSGPLTASRTLLFGEAVRKYSFLEGVT